MSQRLAELERKLRIIAGGDLDNCLSCHPMKYMEGYGLDWVRAWIVAAAVIYALREAGLDPQAISSFLATRYHKPKFQLGGTREFVGQYGYHIPCCSAQNVVEAAKALLGEE